MPDASSRSARRWSSITTRQIVFVAGFIGSPTMNTVPCVIESAGVGAKVTPQGGNSVSVTVAIPGEAAGSQGTFGVRPEHLKLTTDSRHDFRRSGRHR